MSLTAAIQIGRSALVSSQVGIQVAGNNLANAATPGYSRQVLGLTPTRDQILSNYTAGRGVSIERIQRQVDEALEARLRAGLADEASAATRLDVLSQLESTLNELSGSDLSTELTDFFNVWSDAANLINSDAVVVQQGASLASFVRSLRTDLTDLRGQIETQIDSRVQRADALLDELATINRSITASETAAGEANALRDRRAELLAELSTLFEVTAVEDNQGLVDVYVGTTPVVLAGENRGLGVQRRSLGDRVSTQVVLGSDQTPLEVSSGSLGGLLATRDGEIDATLDRLDEIAANLIFEVNKLHATGVTRSPGRLATSSLAFAAADRDVPLNSPTNGSVSGLPFQPKNGGFFVNVVNDATGTVRRTRIDVDLDGLTDTLAAGVDDDTSAQDIADALNAVPGITAGFTPDGRLSVTADRGFSFSFSEDSSDVLGVFGVNGFFTGQSGLDIGVRSELERNPSLLAKGRLNGTALVENGTALAITDLRSNSISRLGSVSIRQSWSDAVASVGVQTGFAETAQEAATLVRESLQAQKFGLSGVSVDEETINLLTFQRQFQGAAQLVSIADELLNTLISIA